MNQEPYIIGGQDADESEWPWQVRFNEKRSVTENTDTFMIIRVTYLDTCVDRYM